MRWRAFTAMALWVLGSNAMAESTPQDTEAYSFSFPAIAGGEMSLADYKGKVVVVVNTASQCGFTGQYDSLQALYDAHADDGLVVVGVPSNSFNQELSSEAEVKDFCEQRFDLTFPLTAITPVKGGDSHPFYNWVRESTGENGFPGWNFNKVVLGRDGALLATYGATANPLKRNALQKDLVKTVETALAAPAS